jgi:hypothetical protein
MQESCMMADIKILLDFKQLEKITERCVINCHLFWETNFYFLVILYIFSWT